MLALVGSTYTRHTSFHSETHMAKMVRKPMKVAMSARPLRVSMKTLPTPHHTQTKKSEWGPIFLFATQNSLPH